MHRDTGGYATTTHRIHVPIATGALASFQACDSSFLAFDCLGFHVEQPFRVATFKVC
jgi:hypothetical protein